MATQQTWQLSTGGNTSCYALVDTPAITDRYVSYDGSSETLHQEFSYTPTTWVTSSTLPPYWTSKIATVTDYKMVGSSWVASQAVKYTYSNSAIVNGTQSGGIGVPLERTLLYLDGSGNTLKTVNKGWFDPYTMIADQTILPNNQGLTTIRCPDIYDRIVSTYEYNSQSAGAAPPLPSCTGIPIASAVTTAAIGPLVRQTNTVFHSFGNGATYTHILDEPDSVTTLNGSVPELKQTTYLYDTTAIQPSGTKTGQAAAPGLRGNATSVSEWLSTGNTLLTTTYEYFDTGQVYKKTEPCGNATCLDMLLTRSPRRSAPPYDLVTDAI